mmetsp:Transcript_15254/g.50611  ORF Transcript_15254/g.50611 Transcript_15254/m.50611 type:complete len:262 (+) Transcript_15254:481-1266(+)
MCSSGRQLCGRLACRAPRRRAGQPRRVAMPAQRDARLGIQSARLGRPPARAGCAASDWPIPVRPHARPSQHRRDARAGVRRARAGGASGRADPRRDRRERGRARRLRVHPLVAARHPARRRRRLRGAAAALRVRRAAALRRRRPVVLASLRAGRRPRPDAPRVRRREADRARPPLARRPLPPPRGAGGGQRHPLQVGQGAAAARECGRRHGGVWARERIARTERGRARTADAVGGASDWHAVLRRSPTLGHPHAATASDLS